MMLRPRSDVPFDQDASGRFLPTIIAFMVYLAALALVGSIILNGSISRWSVGLSGSLTVQIEAASHGEQDNALERVLGVLATTEGVATARPLTPSEIQALLEPWIGSGNLTDDLPVPRLIDVILRPRARVDLENLAQRLQAAAPGASIDDHKLWLDSLVRLGRAIQLAAAAVVLFVGFAAVAVVVFTTRAGLAVHHDAIEIMHIIGARDAYVAGQFQRHTLLHGLKGGALGLALAVATLYGLQYLLDGLAAPHLPVLTLSISAWVVLAALPLVASLIATLTARITVLRTLARLP